jgi:transposase-like protein
LWIVEPVTRAAITRFATEYDAKYPKAVATLENDIDVLLTFYDSPAAHEQRWCWTSTASL